MKDTRENIINAAMKLFAEKGYAGCTIREICREAGVTKPVLYYHFQGKENLYRELMLDIFDNTRKNLLRLSKSCGPIRDRLIEFVSSEFNDCKRDANSIRLVFRMMFSPEEGYPFFNFIEEYVRERAIIAESLSGREEAAAHEADPELFSTALMGMMLIQILEFLFTGRNTLTKQNARKLIGLLLPPPADWC
ncbi:MAG: TetR/AcrR family transcriptional regulator [Acidobacteria bacterium]|nr:TetR/AcrR family transcriptional regulator [Acidobacteriota bacterium]